MVPKHILDTLLGHLHLPPLGHEGEYPKTTLIAITPSLP